MKNAAILVLLGACAWSPMIRSAGGNPALAAKQAAEAKVASSKAHAQSEAQAAQEEKDRAELEKISPQERAVRLEKFRGLARRCIDVKKSDKQGGAAVVDTEASR